MHSMLVVMSFGLIPLLLLALAVAVRPDGNERGTD